MSFRDISFDPPNKFSDFKRTILDYNATQFWILFAEAVRVQLYFGFLVACMLGMFLCASFKLGYGFHKSKSRLRIVGLIMIALIAIGALKYRDYKNRIQSTASGESGLKFWRHQTEDCRKCQGVNNDNKLREIIKWHKLYAFAMEMKKPPQVLAYVRDYFLHK